MFVVIEPIELRGNRVQRDIQSVLSGMTEGCMADVMREGAGLNQIPIQSEAGANRGRQLHHFDTVGKPLPHIVGGLE
jgi:hypothetical protein